MLSDWHLALSRVKTPSALVGICNEFLASWTPEQLATLPQDCRPSHFDETSQIQHWIGVLAEALCAAGADEATDGLRHMLGFLFRASDRAAEIDGHGAGCGCDALPSVLANLARDG